MAHRYDFLSVWPIMPISSVAATFRFPMKCFVKAKTLQSIDFGWFLTTCISKSRNLQPASIMSDKKGLAPPSAKRPSSSLGQPRTPPRPLPQLRRPGGDDGGGGGDVKEAVVGEDKSVILEYLLTVFEVRSVQACGCLILQPSFSHPKRSRRPLYTI